MRRAFRSNAGAGRSRVARRATTPLVVGLALALRVVGWESGALVVAGCGVPKPKQCDSARCEDGGAGDWADSLGAPEAVAGDGGPSSDVARTIHVNTTAEGAQADGLCSLAEALEAVNSGAPVNGGDCPAGGRHSVILLGAGVFQLGSPLLATRDLELRGAGMHASIVTAGALSSPGTSPGTPPPACALTVAATPEETVRLRELTLTGGTEPRQVTGVCLESGNVWIRQVRLNAFGSGGLSSRSTAGSVSLFNSLVDGNRSPGDGGGIAYRGESGRIYIEQSALVNNSSAGRGGALFVSAAGLNTIKNATISGNMARQGGGVAILVQDLGYMAIYSATVTGNTASETGGGLFQEAIEPAVVNTILNGDIVAGNIAGADRAQDNLNADWGSHFTCTNSLLHIAALARRPHNVSGSCAYEVPDVGLGPLMNMGGVGGLPVHPLLPGSPAIDAIDATGSAEHIQQRDLWNASAGDPQVGWGAGDTPPWTLFGRPVDGDGDGAADEDIGPFEFNPRWETELLVASDLSPLAEHQLVTSPPPAALPYSHDAGMKLVGAAPGVRVTYSVPVPQAGTYAVSIGVVDTPDGGRFQVSVASRPGATPVALGGEQDAYAAVPASRRVALGQVAIGAPGEIHLTLAVTGKAAASGGYQVVADFIELDGP